MGVLDLITILLTSMLAGNELAVSWFFNPAIWQLDERPQATALSLLARSLGKLMPFWYSLCFVLLSVEAYLRRHSPSHIFVLAAVVIWLATILYHGHYPGAHQQSYCRFDACFPASNMEAGP